MAVRKPVLSPTRISTFLECRRLYRYVYINKLPRYFGARPHFSLGVSVHRALEEHHKAGGPDQEGASALVERLEKAWVGAGYESAEAEQAKLSQAREWLSAYHQDGAGQEGETLYTEKTLRVDMGEYVLSGRVDRLDRLPGGELEVIDYKSGVRAPTEDDVADELAVAIYQLLVSRVFDCPRVKGSLYHLGTNGKVSFTRGPEDLAEVARAVDAVFAEMEAEKLFEPVKGEHCEGCDFYARCWGRRQAT